MILGIVGAGQAACTLILELIRGNFRGQVLIFNGEAIPPYQRPPLSKDWLQNPSRDRLNLLPKIIEQDSRITWISRTVTSIDPGRGTIRTRDTAHTVDHIILATGTRAKKLEIPGLSAQQNVSLRTLNDAENLRLNLAQASTINIVGAGFLAFELAASLSKFGITVRILAKGPRALPQVGLDTAEYLSSRSDALIMTETRLIKFDRKAQSLLSNQGPISCDLVITAIGSEPNIELAEASGLATTSGIPVDVNMQTNHPRVSAIGEVAEYHHTLIGKKLRIESIAQANETACILATHLLEQQSVRHKIPWFWSNQGSEKLQIAGFSERSDDSFLLMDKPHQRVVLRHKDGRVTAVEAINAAREYMAARRLFESNEKSISLNTVQQAGSIFSLLQSSSS
ncbi:FAD-dependent oxidoreductase [Litorivicinus sp.]|nr:FAD-dependent oxidoreductase [Litorivicinus sp.]MDC1208223.1 FAD-dependent oxidoreductase [Litorivicinus sp.]MDC1466080.1 FAD-dependent oxidoreductase [Litorivicinus sp.]